MRMIRMSEYDCFLTSAAMILEVEPEDLVEEIGHDGKTIWWSKAKGEAKKRGYHIQEYVDCCLRRQLSCTCIERYPYIGPENHTPRAIWDEKKCDERFAFILDKHPGLLIGRNEHGLGHAVAWDGYMVYDPIGQIYDLKSFDAIECWLTV